MGEIFTPVSFVLFVGTNCHATLEELFGSKNFFCMHITVKSNITITLGVVVLLGMLLVNFTLTVFWQRSMRQQAVKRGDSILEAILEIAALLPREQVAGEILAKYVNGSSANFGCLYLYSNTLEVISSSLQCDDPEMVQIVKRTAFSKQPLQTSYGFTRGLLFPAKKYVGIAEPMNRSDGHFMAIGIRLSLVEVYVELRKSQKIILSYIFINLIFLTAIGFFRFFRTTIRPLEKLVEIADEYPGDGMVDFQIDHSGNEYRKLSGALESMLQRIETDRKKLRDTVSILQTANEQLQKTQQEMVRTEKLASVGRLASGLAHEIGNPLGIILGYLGLLQQQQLSGKERKSFVANAEHELQRISRLVYQLKELARNPNPSEKQYVSMHEVIGNILSMLQPQSMMEHINVIMELNADHDVVSCNKDQIRQVLLNCILNSVDALEQKKGEDNATLSVSTQNVDGGIVQIKIEDNGSGIDKSDLQNVFDPFFTTKEPGKGTGLGLSVSHAIIEDMEGTIAITSNGRQGTIVTIHVPMLRTRPCVKGCLS